MRKQTNEHVHALSRPSAGLRGNRLPRWNRAVPQAVQFPGLPASIRARGLRPRAGFRLTAFVRLEFRLQNERVITECSRHGDAPVAPRLRFFDEAAGHQSVRARKVAIALRGGNAA